MSAIPSGFDPMGEAFRSRENAYEGLPDDQQPWYRAKTKGGGGGGDGLMTSAAHELFVGNLPPNLTQDGLRNLFSKYGNVISVRLGGLNVIELVLVILVQCLKFTSNSESKN